jgi:signal transduction histidine kinase
MKMLLANEDLSISAKESIASMMENATQNLSKINHHGQRAEAIVKAMMMHSGKSTGQKQPTDINLLADEYLKLSYHGMRAKEPGLIAYLQTEFDESLSTIDIIPQEIGRVFLNLFNNSFYSILKKKKLSNGRYEPTVFVSTKRVEGGIEIKVRDNGIGIARSEAGKIYQPFYTTKPAGEGVGLGLSLTYDIITKGHGGLIKLNSEEGEFAEFSFILPDGTRPLELQSKKMDKVVPEFCI